jgi:hypothetical protein
VPVSKRGSGWQLWAYNKSFEPTARLRLAAASTPPLVTINAEGFTHRNPELGQH